MGDRCYCTLYVRMLDMSEELLSLIMDQDDLEEVIETKPGMLSFGFDEVNYGQMPAEIHKYAEDHKLTLQWYNGRGDSYGEEVRLFGVENRKWNEVNYQVCEFGHPVISSDDIFDPQLRLQFLHYANLIRVFDGNPPRYPELEIIP